MSVYFYPLITKPIIVDGPGDYLTRCGERVSISSVSTKHDFGCRGQYLACGTAERWHKSGRIMATSETANDIVSRA